MSGYRSHWTTDQSIRRAHVVVTAEQAHVIGLAGRWPDAPDPLSIECSEQDEGAIGGDGETVGDIPEQCLDFYIEQDVAPATTQPPVPTTTIQPVETLPKTGSGVSPVLGMGSALLIGGGIIIVATRRRSAATTS